MNRILLSLIFALLISQTVKAQDSIIIINNREYQKFEDTWYFYDPIADDTFLLNQNMIVVKFKESVNDSIINSLLTMMNLNIFIKPVLGWHNLIVDSTDDVFVKYMALSASEYVNKSYIATYGKYHAVPVDPLFGDQWYLQKINVMAAWDITTGDPSIVVGVMDNGIEFNRHIDLNKHTHNYFYNFEDNEYENIYNNNSEADWTSWWYPPSGNGIDDDDWDDNPDTYIDDWKGWVFGMVGYGNSPIPAMEYGTNWQHGSLVAGIIGAKTNNYNSETGVIGIAGIAGGWGNHGCKILPLALGITHPEPLGIPFAVEYALAHNVKIIQLSLGISPTEEYVEEALLYAYENGITIICSSGNDNEELVKYPANLPFVIAVGGTDYDDYRAEFAGYCGSTFGGADYGEELDISAPSVCILSTTANTLTSQYVSKSGTSFAAPQVSGVAALMLSINPCLTNNQVREVLCYSADKTGGYNYNWNYLEKPGHSKELGYGRLNAYQAVKMAQDMHTLSWDLYMRDRYFDMGVEPNADNVMYISKDIWIRNADDDGLTHENPIYDPVNPVYVYVRVRNKGCEDYPGEEADLYMYWAKASTGLSWPSPWTDVSGSPQMGGVIGSIEIPAIPIGGEVIVKLPWMVPDPEEYENEFVSSGMFTVINDRHHFCLLARIVSESDPMTFTETSNNFDNVKNNNNIIQKNISIMDASTSGSRRSHSIVSLGNFSTNNKVPYDFKITTNSEFTTRNLLQDAVVTVKLDSITWNKWVAGGMQSSGLSVLNQGVNHELKLTDTIAYLNNISYNYLESSRIAIEVDFSNSNNYDSRYAIDMVQLLNSTTIIGGERFEIIAPNTNSNRPENSQSDDIHQGNSSILTIYPNPANDWIQYAVEDNIIVFGVLIVDMHGREIYKLKFGDKINVSNLSAGMYILKLITNRGVISEKFIKN